ncbi:S16 family serine protease [Paenibacillus ihuae]|uniref:S16 family serine protease n=1 Tax=Paenibacillus ihuae TaxID=1232431 RepID=UPI00131CE5BF|nr:S16 family serine protease [Paenibacillus ihuae]
MLPSNLAPSQELFRNPIDNGIYIPSVIEEKADNFLEYFFLKAKYGELLSEFEELDDQVLSTAFTTTKDNPGHVEIVDNNLMTDSLLYVALPAYIAGSYAAGLPADFSYAFEFTSTTLELEDLLGTTIITIDSAPPTIEKVNELVRSKTPHEFELRTYKGNIVNKTASIYGITVSAHYTINDLWRFNEMMLFELGNVSGDSGGVATAYNVFLKMQGLGNKNGKFVITGAINIDGTIRSVGSIKAKTYLAVKKSMPVMFVPDGVNYTEAINMKESMNSDIKIVPIKNLDDIERYWNNRKG